MKPDFDWSELAFKSKKPIRELDAIFIAAPRTITKRRFAQLVKRYLPLGNMVIGIAKEPYVLGFENQPQFTMLTLADIEEIIQKVNGSAAPHKIYTLSYFQREQKHLFEKTGFSRAIFINGSWKLMFHTSGTFYALVQAGLPYEQVSPFADEQEAREYEAALWPKLREQYEIHVNAPLSEAAMLEAAQTASCASYDHSYQTGVALGKKTAEGTYELIATAFNKVVPFQTYAWHYGPSREVNFSPPGDLNHYDAVHAEVELIVKAAEEKINLKDTTLFINLLPCPSCARMFSETSIAEFVYSEDHSAGYAVQLLEKAGKTVRRVVPEKINKEEG
ncbi:MAG TPA: deaminase [Verrucomicrobiae bacterium]|nr:deaminase [Verrucomicrobiae bacterium]